MIRRVLLGLAAFLLALLVVLPAGWVAGLVPQVEGGAWSGSIWRGQGRDLVLRLPGAAPLQVDALRWSLHPASLLRMALDADIRIASPQGDVEGRVTLGHDKLMLRNLTASALLDSKLLGMMPAGWSGRLEARDAALSLQGTTVLDLAGTFSVRDATDGRGGQLGSYRVEFPAGSQSPFSGQLRDESGPFETQATVTLSSDRAWSLEGTVRPRDPAWARSLELLGPADGAGRHPLSLTGSFR